MRWRGAASTRVRQPKRPLARHAPDRICRSIDAGDEACLDASGKPHTIFSSAMRAQELNPAEALALDGADTRGAHHVSEVARASR
jgi:hypothetical protein